MLRQLPKALEELRPDAVIHCAAWTAVDLAEDDDKVEKVRAVNASGTQQYCQRLQGAGLQDALSFHGLCL